MYPIDKQIGQEEIKLTCISGIIQGHENQVRIEDLPHSGVFGGLERLDWLSGQRTKRTAKSVGDLLVSPCTMP